MSENFSFHEQLLAFHREDYYTVLRIKKNPGENTSIRWNALKTKYSLTLRFQLL
jgi:hypothetical protein